MKVFNNELVVKRGESFVLSKTIRNKDGSPYIISNMLDNPYWLISITSGLFNYDSRYICNKWLSLANHVRFNRTTPIDLKSLGYDSWDTTPLPAGYEGDNDYYANEALFKLEEAGNISYKYWQYNNRKEGYDGTWTDYNCIINTNFDREITSDWIEQNYYYSIDLVSGVNNSEYLDFIRRSDSAFSNFKYDEDLYNYLSKNRPDLLINFDIDRPLYTVRTSYPILESKKIYVKVDFNGGIL